MDAFLSEAKMGQHLMLRIKGDSMSPAVSAGDEVVVRVVSRRSLSRLLGKPVLVQLRNGMTTFRRLREVRQRRPNGPRECVLGADNDRSVPRLVVCPAAQISVLAVGLTVQKCVGLIKPQRADTEACDQFGNAKDGRRREQFRKQARGISERPGVETPADSATDGAGQGRSVVAA